MNRENAHRGLARTSFWLVSLTILGLSALPTIAEAQEHSVRLVEQIKALRLTADELTQLEVITLSSYKVIQAAEAEINGFRADLTHQLLSPTVEVKDLEPIVHQSLDSEYKVRIAELDRQLKIRTLLGNRRWARLSRIGVALRVMEKSRLSQELGSAEDPAIARVVNILHNMGY
jgi:hypothetical protein